MSATAPHGAPLNRTPAPTESPNDEIHPDVLEHAASRGIKRRRDLLHMQAQYDQAMADRAAREERMDPDDAPSLWRNLGRNGSRAADPQGDRIARRTKTRNAA